MLDTELVRTEIAKLALGPDDVLVLRYDGDLDIEDVEAIRQVTKGALAPKDPPVLILTGGLELSTLRLDQCPSDFVNDLVTAVVRRMADHLRLEPPQ